ncbi:hypothetical protein [uncultured Adlercreutzia sp.]|uniref:hypothetical protein n=1 Tax=uncultured Adlercreutzia sp. TaxID=875803 RepID=UPI0026F3C8C7|nr:hypothetical protein [uncultured Adlercreutzia sp.]
MDFVLVLIGTLVFVMVFKDALRKLPGLFYGLALVLSFLYAITGAVAFPVDFKLLLFSLIQKGTLATALFIIVMYMGVFRDVAFVKHRLMPTRAPLSIIACILILGHVIKYAFSFATTMGMMTTMAQVGLALGVLAFWLMIPLGISSLQAVKKKMSTASWLALQKWAYLFYGLVYVHLAVLLGPPAFSGAGAASRESLVVYTVLFGVYAVLRVGKAIMDKHKEQTLREGAAGCLFDSEDQLADSH